MWSARERKTIRKTPSGTTLQEAGEAWLAAAEAGMVRTRAGEAYKPSAVRAYRQARTHRAFPVLGAKWLTAISHSMLQDFADRLSADGLSPSSARNTILPLRAIFRRAHRRGDVAVNPTLKLTLPVVRSERERVAAPTEVGPLLDALEADDRAIFATALYAGLRLGELQALQWDDVDLNANLIHVTRSWDRQTGFVAPKSRSGNRRVPITATLRRELLNHRLFAQAGINVSQLAIMVLGVLVITGEYSTGMIRASMTAVPKRLPVLWAKLGFYAVASFLLMLPSVLIAFFASQAILSRHHILQISFSHGGVARAVIGGALYLTLIGIFALALGAIIRNTAGGIATFVALFFVIPPLLNVLPTSWQNAINPYIPNSAARSIFQLTHSSHSLSPTGGLALTAAYTAAAIATAAILLLTRDT